jgi:hypothetical protein
MWESTQTAPPGPPQAITQSAPAHAGLSAHMFMSHTWLRPRARHAGPPSHLHGRPPETRTARPWPAWGETPMCSATLKKPCLLPWKMVALRASPAPAPWCCPPAAPRHRPRPCERMQGQGHQRGDAWLPWVSGGGGSLVHIKGWAVWQLEVSQTSYSRPAEGPQASPRAPVLAFSVHFLLARPRDVWGSVGWALGTRLLDPHSQAPKPLFAVLAGLPTRLSRSPRPLPPTTDASGTVHTLTASVVTIGRGEGCTIVVPRQDVSRLYGASPPLFFLTRVTTRCSHTHTRARTHTHTYTHSAHTSPPPCIAPAPTHAPLMQALHPGAGGGGGWCASPHRPHRRQLQWHVRQRGPGDQGLPHAPHLWGRTHLRTDDRRKRHWGGCSGLFAITIRLFLDTHCSRGMPHLANRSSCYICIYLLILSSV